MRINHNINALNSWRNISMTNMDMSKTLERLSSGLRINRAGDDAAGLAISEKMRGQIRGLEMAIKNSQDAISLIQTAEGALTEVHSILQRMRELSVQAATDTNTNVDRDQIQAELNQLREEIDRIARTTEFNTKKLLDGKLEGFRFKADVKVVTGGNIDLKAQEVNYTNQNVKSIATWSSTVAAGSIQNINIDVGNATFDYVYRKLSTNINGLELFVGFKSVGDNTVRVVVYSDESRTNLLGSRTITGAGGQNAYVYLNDIFDGNRAIFLGALSVGFNANANNVTKAKLVNSKVFTSSNGFLTESISTNISGTPTIPVINLGGSNASSNVRILVQGVAITLSFKSVTDNTILVAAIRNGTVLGTSRYDDTSTNVSFKLIRDVYAGNTLLNISNITITFANSGERVTGIQFRGTAYFDTRQSQVVASANNVTTNGSSLTFTTLTIGGGAAIGVGFQSVGNNQVRYVVRSYSGMTITSGTIAASDLNAIGLKTVNLGDDLTLNIQFEQFQSENVRLNQADIYITSKNNQANEGSYVVEVGQFIGGVSSQLDFRIVKSDGSGISVSNQGALRKGFSVTDGTVFTWRPTEHTIGEFGDALPNEEIIDSAVARIEGKYTQDTQLIFQIGSNEGHNMFVGIDDMSAGALGITTSSLKVTDQNSAERAIMVVDAAIHKVSSARAALGAVQNRLEHTIANLGVAAENLTAAESRIRDADMAKEMMAFTKQQILLQSSMSMLAQANAQPQNVLQLLR